MKYHSCSEEELISLSKKENHLAFEELTERNRTYIHGWILSHAKNQTETEEIYQTTLIKCWKSIKKFKCNSLYRTWANRIALNVLRDNYRKKCRNKSYSLESMVENGFSELNFPVERNKGVENIERLELRNELEGILSKMKGRHSQVLRMYLLKDMSYKEISQKLKCPIGTVMSRLYYAKREAKYLYQFV